MRRRRIALVDSLLPAAAKCVAAALTWFTELFATDVVGVLPLAREAALLAGRLRAIHPAAPSIAKGGRCSKPERGEVWVRRMSRASV